MKITKILSIALCLLMLLSLVACGTTNNDDDKEPTTVAEYVARVNEAMKNVKVKETSKETLTQNGEEQPTETTITYIDGQNSMSENEYGGTTIFVNDTLYVSMPSLEVKNKLSNATQKGTEIGEAIGTAIGIDETNSGANAYKSSSFKKNDDGTVTLIFSSNSEGFEEAMDNVFNDISAGAANYGVAVSGELGASSQIIVIDKDYRIISITRFDENTISVSTSEGFVSVTTVKKTEQTYSYDEAISVTVPEDDAEYKEVSSFYELYY